MAGTKPFDKFFSKPDFWGPNDLFPPGKPSIEVGGRSLPPQLMGFPEGRGRLDPQKSRFERKCKKSWGCGPKRVVNPLIVCDDRKPLLRHVGSFYISFDNFRGPGAAGTPNIDETLARLPSSTQTRPWFSRCPAVPGSRCAPSSKQLRAMQLCLQSREQGTVFISCALGSSPTPCDRRLQTPNKHAL